MSGWSQREETETYNQKHRRYSGQSKWRQATERRRRAQWTDRQKDRTSLSHSRGRGNKQRLQREWDTVNQVLDFPKGRKLTTKWSQYLQSYILHTLCVLTLIFPKRLSCHAFTPSSQTGDSPCPSTRLWQLCELLGRTRLGAALAEPVVRSWRATRMDMAQQWPSSQTWLSSGPWKRQRCLDLHHCFQHRGRSYEACWQGEPLDIIDLWDLV